MFEVLSLTSHSTLQGKVPSRELDYSPAVLVGREIAAGDPRGAAAPGAGRKADVAEDGGDLMSRIFAAEQAADFYSQGVREAAVSLPSVHSVRLGLSLNLSVFQHEVLANTKDAIQTARMALAEAGKDLASVPEEARNDAILTMQLLQDNLALWEPENA